MRTPPCMRHMRHATWPARALLLALCCSASSAENATTGLNTTPPAPLSAPPSNSSATAGPAAAPTTFPLPVEPLDLAVPGNLTLALQLRASKEKRIILFALDMSGDRAGRSHMGTMWQLMAYSMMKRLHDSGHDFYIAVASNAAVCRAVHAEWPDSLGFTPSCAYSSEPYHLSHVVDIAIGRYWVLAKLAERGYDVLLTDLDFTIHRDLFGLLDSPPLSAYAAVFMEESPVNSGTTFVRGTRAHPRGGVLWTIREVARRHLLVHQFEMQEHNNPGSMFDQALLGFALGVASRFGLSEWDWWEQYSFSRNKDSKFWKIHPPGAPREGFRWNKTAELFSTPWPECPSQEAAECERWDSFKARFQMEGVPLLVSQLCTPFDCPYHDADVPCERVAAGPSWLWGHGERVSHGWVGASAATHWLGIEKTWSRQMTGSHAGRFNTVLAARLLDPVFISVPRLRENRSHDAAVWNHAFRHSYDEATKVMTAAFTAAVRAGITFVAPAIPCDAPWVVRSNETRTGILDWRVIETFHPDTLAPDGRCWPAQAGWDTCFVHHHFVYAFMLEPANADAPERPRLPDSDAERVINECKGWNGEVV